MDFIDGKNGDIIVIDDDNLGQIIGFIRLRQEDGLYYFAPTGYRLEAHWMIALGETIYRMNECVPYGQSVCRKIH